MGERKGDRVLLTWTQPTETTDNQGIRHPGVTRICRAVDEYPMAECRDIVKELGPTELTSIPGSGQEPKIFYEHVIPNDLLGGNRYATYAIEVFNDHLRSAGLSNQVRVPLAPTLPPPHELHVTVDPEGPVIRWTGLSHNQVAAGPDVQVRYRVYRRVAGQPNYTLVDEVPLNGPNYSVTDTSFQWEQTYDYKVASVTSLPQPVGRMQTEIEGDDSPVARVTVHDSFPPEQPAGLQAVYSGVGQRPFIDLTWAPNTEPDLAGYILYRHEDGQQPVALNQQPVPAPAFRDDNVEPGHTYTYSVRAVDVRGNQSPLSQETSETVPK